MRPLHLLVMFLILEMENLAAGRKPCGLFTGRYGDPVFVNFLVFAVLLASGAAYNEGIVDCNGKAECKVYAENVVVEPVDYSKLND